MGEPNARDMGRMTSQPKVKGEMYILNDVMNMKAEIAAMERRLEELEMNQMQEMQAISQTPLLPMPCAIYRSYEHLVDECPTILVEREMFGDCNTYNSNWRDHPNFSWKPQPPQYQQPAQAPQQASNLEQAMVNLCKVVGDFVGKQEAINAQINQRIDRMESTLNKRMDEMQNDMAQKLDILQDSISRLANLNTMQEKENSPSQPYQNSMSIHEMEAKEGESSMVKEIEEVITLRSGKEVDLPTCKLEHKGKNRGLRDFAASAKSAFCCQTIPQHCRSLCENFRSCETHCEVKKADFATKVPFRKGFRGCESTFGTRVPFRSTVTLISQLRNGCEAPKRENSQFRSQSSIPQGISQLRSRFWHTSAISQHSDSHFAAAKWLRSPKSEKSQFHSRTPISAIVGHISITSRSSNYAYNISLESLGSQESIASNGLDLDLKRKSYGHLKMIVQTMNGNVAPPFCYCWTHF
ncbi:hypothetical protein CK203_046515 [Vitis vinifera]|uniref:Uncharacterized protein n=1 Tax=Vitis vinifera TaxID=29760 RepID=A0A438ILG6_VITVI|nr:hypothetical protein CK203_046515 [Vitis vinifera]